LRDAELLGPRIFPQFQFLQKFSNTLWFCDLAEIVRKRFSLLPKARLHEIQKLFRVADSGLRAGAGKAKGDQRRSHFGRRAERTGRKLQYELWPRVELGGDGKITVIFVAGLRGEAQGHFQLDHDVNFFYLIGERKEAVQDRRSDVVRKIPVEADAPASRKGAQIDLEHVPWNHRKIRVLACEALQVFDERRVKFDGINGDAAANKILRHFPVARANFNPAVILNAGICGTFHAVRGNANRAGDFFAPAGITQKMLSKFLSGHEDVICQSISSFAMRGQLGRLRKKNHLGN